jgi:hypothetical protein
MNFLCSFDSAAFILRCSESQHSVDLLYDFRKNISFEMKLANNILSIFNCISYFIPSLHYLSLLYILCKSPIMAYCIFKYKQTFH